MHSFSRSCSVVFAVASLVVACGGAPPSPQAPAAPAEKQSEPDSIADAQDQIARARAELEQAMVHREPSDGKAADTSSTPAKKSTPPQPGTAPPSATKPADAVPSKPEDTCGNPCRALASMRRAVTALCRMTGEEDGRCVEAKRTLSTSEARVASCPCAKG